MLSAPTRTAPARSRRATSGASTAAGGRLALDLRAGARRQAGDVEQVLDRERHAGERQRVARAIAVGEAPVERRGARARALGDDVGEGVDRRIDGGDARQARLDHRRRADGARSHRLGDRGGGAGEELAGPHRGEALPAAGRSSGPIGVNTGAGSSRDAERRGHHQRRRARRPARSRRGRRADAPARAAGRARPRRRRRRPRCVRDPSAACVLGTRLQRRTSRWKISRLFFLAATKLGSESVATVRGRASAYGRISATRVGRLVSSSTWSAR